jgi:hypothetical protein
VEGDFEPFEDSQSQVEVLIDALVKLYLDVESDVILQRTVRQNTEAKRLAGR